MKEESTFETLVARIRTAHRDLSAHASRAVNISLTLRNGLIGYYIDDPTQRSFYEAEISETRNKLRDELKACLERGE